MFDFESQYLISRMERERQMKALALAAAARPGRRSGLRAGVATGLTRLALAVHRDAAAGAVPRPQADSAGFGPEQKVANA